MMQYSFSYDDYFRYGYQGLLTGWAIGIVIVLSIVAKVVFDLYRKRHVEFIGSVLSTIFVLSFLIITTWPTLKYSLHLPYESEKGAVSTYGKIDEISPVIFSPKYNIGNDGTPYFASVVTISGDKYYIISATGLAPGMTVKIVYLPKSRMVLECLGQ